MQLTFQQNNVEKLMKTTIYMLKLEVNADQGPVHTSTWLTSQSQAARSFEEVWNLGTGRISEKGSFLE